MDTVMQALPVSLGAELRMKERRCFQTKEEQ